jgi:hypothetical protein
MNPSIEEESLVGRLEEATGPDRELDARVHRAATGAEYLISSRSGPVLNDGSPIPPYTESIDAALTTLEDGWEYSISTLYSVAEVELPLNDARIDPVRVRRPDGNVALAIVTAMLKARAALNPRTGIMETERG